MPHSESGACVTLFPKNSKKAKRWLIPKNVAYYLSREQGGRYGPGAINLEEKWWVIRY
jgi:hypothetical protein